MSPKTDDTKVVTPVSIDEEADSEYDSPAERIKDALGDDLHRDFVAASDDHPLVETAGSKEALLSNTPVKVQKLLSDDLYQDPGVFWREWLQNHTAACIREAKRRVKNAHGEDALYHEYRHDHEDLESTVTVRLPKGPAKILPMARDLGYDPVIEFEVNHDERLVTTRDNGIAMTTGEVIQVWNEPAESASGGDQSSAGNKGIGALTWASIAGSDGALKAKTRTLREQTVHTEQDVPERDREGFQFYSFLGGVIPIPGGVSESFYGTEFEIPVQQSVNMDNFKQNFRKYAELLPVKVLWTEYRNGARATDEFEAETFFERYGSDDSSPRIRIDRPGEFSMALDKPDVVPKGHSDTDTFLLDMPIERNTYTGDDPDTLWNDHLQIHNEQGLIVAGPNRGKLAQNVDELHEDDVPMPTPTADRDRLSKEEAHQRFVEYIDGIAVEKEREVFSEFANSYLATDTLDDALTYVRSNTDEFDLLVAMMKQHGTRNMETSPESMFDYFAGHDDFDFDGDAVTKEAFVRNARKDDKPHGYAPRIRKESHEKWQHLKLLKRLHLNVSCAPASTAYDPNKKENRTKRPLVEVVSKYDDIYVGKKLNWDRARVVAETYEDRDESAVLIKPEEPYREWTRAPFHAEKLVDVPFTKGDHEWSVPDHVHDNHTATPAEAAEQEDPEEHVKIRSRKDTTAVDYKWALEKLHERLRETPFGGEIQGLYPKKLSGREQRREDFSFHRFVVVFPTTHDRNVSDYYHWQRHAALIRCKVATAEDLRQHSQVFLPEHFERFLEATEIQTYDPFTGEYGSVTAERTLAPDPERQTLFLDPENNYKLACLITGARHSSLPRDDAKYARLRRLVLHAISRSFRVKNPLGADYVCPGCRDDFGSAQGLSLHQNYCEGDGNLADPERAPAWRVAFWTDGLTEERLRRFYRLYPEGGTLPRIDLDDEGEEWIPTPRILHGEKSAPALNVGSQRPSSYRKLLKRGPYTDAWAFDSKVWKQYSTTNRRRNRPNGHEQAMYQALREHGIDPYEHDPAQLRRALEHLLDSGVGC